MRQAAIYRSRPRHDRRYDQACAVLTVPVLMLLSDGEVDRFTQGRLVEYCMSSAVFHDFDDSEVDRMVSRVLEQISQDGIRFCFDKARRGMASSLRETALSLAMRLAIVNHQIPAARAAVIGDMAKLLRISDERYAMLQNMVGVLQNGPA